MAKFGKQPIFAEISLPMIIIEISDEEENNNFDENKNCKQEKLIKQLLKDEDDIRCSRKNRGTHLNMKHLNIFYIQ